MKGTKTLLSYILFIVGFQWKAICTLPPVCENDYFTCGNKDCVPNFWKCDGSDDCGDNSDEVDCPVAPAVECTEAEMQCKNKRCINIKWKCDNEDDCGDNSDEMNCTAIQNYRPCDETTNFRCKNGKCIPRSWTCNKMDDCEDNSDEAMDEDPHCVPFDGCKDGYFKCNTSGRCIHNFLVCDGTSFNCGENDNSDELYCAERTCKSTEFKCDNGRCISSQWRCDKQNDCGDLSDERNCSSKSCPDRHFKCIGSGHCVEEQLRCDNVNDCLDGSDEANCDNNKLNTTRTLTTTKTTFVKEFTLVTTRATTKTAKPTRKYTTAFSCEADEYSCKYEKKCLHRNWICDGEGDCKGMDDESAETCSTNTCNEDHFKCANSKCISENNRCDGHDHCGDNSDELDCKAVHVPCTKETHVCKGVTKCIPLSRVCDGKKDCPYDNDDEGKLCGINECLKDNGSCSHGCKDLPLGYECTCPKGYELAPDGFKCVDLNECNVIGKCSQSCVNYKGSFACQCDEGYTLDLVDKRTCYADGPIPYLMFTNRYDLREISVNGRNMKLISEARSASAIAVDYGEKMVYWADNGLKTISRVSLEGSGKPEVILRNVSKPEGLAVDWIGKKLYWSDSFYNEIWVSNLDGSHAKAVIKGGDDERIRALEVYPEKGYIFWANWGRSKIERANLDGTNKHIVLSQGVTWPTSIAIDRTQDRLYWTELSSINSVSINGGAYRQIVDELSRPYGIAVFEDTIYWTDFTEHTIMKASKSDGKNKHKFNGTFTAPLDIEVYHPLSQKSVFHPCHSNNGGCSHLCFMMPNHTSICDCPSFMRLTSDRKTCEFIVPPTTVSTSKIITTRITTRNTAVSTKEQSVTPTTETAKKVVATTKAVPAGFTTAPKTETKAESVRDEVKTNMKSLDSKSEEASLYTQPSVTKMKGVISRSTVHPITHRAVGKPAKEGKSDTKYIVIAIVCAVMFLIIVALAVVCYRKKRSQFDLSMVYETQRESVHSKDYDKLDIEKKYIINPASQKPKVKDFDNINFKDNKDVCVPLNNGDVDGHMMDDYSASDDDNSSGDVCFDDRQPIIQNMV